MRNKFQDFCLLLWRLSADDRSTYGLTRAEEELRKEFKELLLFKYFHMTHSQTVITEPEVNLQNSFRVNCFANHIRR